jgi:GH43 family beta-xylosidase
MNACENLFFFTRAASLFFRSLLNMKWPHHFAIVGFASASLFLTSCANHLSQPASAAAVQTFANPLLPQGPDPWTLCHGGVYYYMHTTHEKLVLWRTKDITDLKHADRKTIWTPTDPANSKHLWAPEIHFVNDKWYVYYAADDGKTDNHQMYVLENSAADPFEGEFIMKGRISTDPDNHWAIDGSVFWSGWQTRRVDTETQCIFIARMANPWTLASSRVIISKPELDWERHWKNENGRNPSYIIYVNEGPEALKSPKGDKIFIVYSASGCWTPFYALGLLTAGASKDLLDPKTWKKSPEPVFRQSPENGVYGTGHNSFFESPDGKETWILYHARDFETDPPNQGDTRSPRAQKIRWTKDGMPIMGIPQPTSTRPTKPSGTSER